MVILTNSAKQPHKHAYPLVVDLDGTLVHTDLLHESVLRLVRDKPYLVVLIPFWLLGGRAKLKKRLAGHVVLDVIALPYNLELIDWLEKQRTLGRKLVLCTAADLSIAQSISDHLELFDEVLASDGTDNLAGKHKAHMLSCKYGVNQFDYIGNSPVDLAVWGRARQGIVVNGSSVLVKKASVLTEIEHVIPSPGVSLTTWFKLFRIHQWIKNLLLFIPLLAAHQVTTADTWIQLVMAFLSFGLCASAVYVANDLLDLESDRKHPRKRYRPFASGHVPVWMGVVCVPVLILSSIFLAQFAGGSFLSWLLVYFVMTCAYSWGLKRLVLVDCLILAILYTLRIVAGAAAVSVVLSFWLLAFSIFLFLSLAFIKRYAELQSCQINGIKKVHGRGYLTSDAPLVQQLGVTSGYASVLVLALYLNSDNVVRLYPSHEIIWGAVPLMLLWLSWMWLQAHRGLMQDDPIVFATRDKASILLGVLFVTTFILARVL